MAVEFPILHKDQQVVVIDKPAGYHVHPPESNAHKVPRKKIILHQLRDQVGSYIYPVHRLDVSTSGVLIFALNSEKAKELCSYFETHRVQKTYWACVRGYTPSQGCIELPLESDSSDLMLESRTDFRTLKQLEIPESVGKRHATARYSWVEVRPRSGRFHQIRRHFNRISHPLIGDAQHGDSKHNRFFRERLGVSGLCLRAISLEFPTLGQQWNCGLNRQWTLLQNIFHEQH